MGATGFDASLDALERQTAYKGGEISPDQLASTWHKQYAVAQAAVELLERVMAENRAVRSALESERRAIGDFRAFLSGEVPTDEPTAWGSGVRTLVGYTPGKASTAVSERSIDAWLKQTHQQLSSRFERARQQQEPLIEQAGIVAAGVQALETAAEQAGDNHRLAVGAVRQALELADSSGADRSRAVVVAVRHTRLAETFALVHRGCREAAAAMRVLVEGLREIVERTQSHASSASGRMDSARDAMLAVDWNAELPQRHAEARAALSSVGELIERTASYIGDAQLLARQHLQRWSKSVAQLDAEIERGRVEKVAGLEQAGEAAARELVANA